MRNINWRLYIWIYILYSFAQAEDLNTSWDGTLYGYIELLDIRNDSLLNPNNQIAALSSRTNTAEARFNFKLESERWQLTARPILLTQAASNAATSEDDSEAYFSQWQARLRIIDSLNLSTGREVLNWGPAQFKSLASPFYFDNGRSNPMRELSGMDNIKVAWSPDMENTVTLARISNSGHRLPNNWHDSWLLKIDKRVDDWSGGISLLRSVEPDLFVGVFGQYTMSDALLLYAEASSSVNTNSLVSPIDTSLPFTVVETSPRRINALIGAAWTFDNGQSLNVEYMRNNHGFNTNEERAYFNRASLNYAQAAYALSSAPLLLGQDYLYLVWQSNPLENGIYWRMMATHSFTDQGDELDVYSEYALNGSVSLFGTAVLPIGQSDQEFSSLFYSSFNLGIKVAFP